MNNNSSIKRRHFHHQNTVILELILHWKVKSKPIGYGKLSIVRVYQSYFNLT